MTQTVVEVVVAEGAGDPNRKLNLWNQAKTSKNTAIINPQTHLSNYAT